MIFPNFSLVSWVLFIFLLGAQDLKTRFLKKILSFCLVWVLIFYVVVFYLFIFPHSCLREEVPNPCDWKWSEWSGSNDHIWLETENEIGSSTPVKKLLSTLKSLQLVIEFWSMLWNNKSFQYKMGWAYWHLRTCRSCVSSVICVLTLLKKNTSAVSSFLQQTWPVSSNFMFLYQQKQKPTLPTPQKTQ